MRESFPLDRSQGIPLARQFYALAIEEFEAEDVLRKKDGCEKGFQAATEAVDAILCYKGYSHGCSQSLPRCQ